MASSGRGGFRPADSATRVLCVSSRIAGHVASAREKADNGNVPVEVFPVQAKAGEFDRLALRVRCVKQAWKPDERYTNGAAVGEMVILCS